MDKIYEITNEIERHITEDPTIKNRFAKHIDCFCKMVEDYGQALQPYEQQYKEADKRYMADPKKYEKYRKPNGAIALTDICPPPKGWVKISSSDNQFLNIDWIALIFRPVEPVNPLLWFGLFGYAGIQRKPEEDEKLMCEYVRLAIVHDYNLLFHSGTPIDTRIISADYKGKWFQRDEFFKTVWYYHSQLTESAQSQLARAFDRILKESVANKPIEANTITLLEKHLKVLKCLDKSTIAKMQVDIAMEAEIGEKTVSLIIRDLKEHHFVSKPQNRSKGTIITQEGKNYLRMLDSRK
jgi:predicted transcriptional regulator